MQGTLGIILSISLAATLVAVVIAVLVVKCYLNWKRQHKKERSLAEGGVPQLVVSSQPLDIIPLLIQGRLEEEEEDDEFDSAFINCYPSVASTKDVSSGQTSPPTNWKEAKIPPPLQRLNSASCVLDRYGQRVTSLSKPQRTNRGESLFFEDSDESPVRRCFSTGSSYSRTRKDSTGLGSRSESANSLSHDSLDGDSAKNESLSRRCQSAASSYSRPRKGSMNLRSRSESNNSLSRESLDGDSTLPDPTLHMRKTVVSTVDKNAPRPKMEKKRKHSTSKSARKTSRLPQNYGNVVFKMTYQADQHTLGVHLIHATELPIRHDRFVDAFARLSLKTSSKRQRFQSKLHKKTCNPIFDEKFVFDGVYISEFQHITSQS